MSNLYRIQALVAAGEKKANVTVEAIIDDMEEATSKVGSFVKAKLTDKENVLELKVWETTLENFIKQTDINGPTLVQCTGDFEFYNGKPQFSMKPFNNAIRIVKSSGNINDYVDAAKYEGEKIYNGLLKIFEETITDPILNRLAKKALTFDSDKIKYFPYSSKYHTEKGGLIAHLYYAYRMALTNEGYAYEFNKQIILTAIICSRLSVFYRYDVEPVTGKINKKNEVQDAMFCQMDNIMILYQLINEIMDEYALEEAEKCEKEEDKKKVYEQVRNNQPETLTSVLHCVAALYGKVSPATPEALMARSYVKNEIKTFEMMKKKKTLARGETAIIDVLGEKLKVIGN